MNRKLKKIQSNESFYIQKKWFRIIILRSENINNQLLCRHTSHHYLEYCKSLKYFTEQQSYIVKTEIFHSLIKLQLFACLLGKMKFFHQRKFFNIWHKKESSSTTTRFVSRRDVISLTWKITKIELIKMYKKFKIAFGKFCLTGWA